MRHRLGRFVVALVVAPAALGLGSACTADPEPIFAAPTATPPSTPAQNRVDSSRPPEQVARAWVEAQNLLLLDGTAGQFRELIGPGCASCVSLFLRPILSTYRKGGEFKTEGWRVKSVSSKDAKAGYEVQLNVTIPGGSTRNSAQSKVVTYPTTQRSVLLEIQEYKGELVVSDVEIR